MDEEIKQLRQRIEQLEQDIVDMRWWIFEVAEGIEVAKEPIGLVRDNVVELKGRDDAN